MTCNARAVALTAERVTWGPVGRSPIISDVSLNVEAGERIAIIGPNGAGKSSFLRCLYRVNRPSSGVVTIGNQDIWSMPAPVVARQMAAVLQEAPADFPLTVTDIVRTGRLPHQKGLGAAGAEDKEKVRHALQHMGLLDFEERLFASLSGGEKQRVLIARALAQDPAILILDEPTNHLDIRHQLEILNLLKGLGITIITTLHDINLAANFADRIAIINNGHLVACGKPSVVLTNKRISETFGVLANRYTVSLGPGPHFFFSLPLKSRKEAQTNEVI